jgi:nucleoid DNA-binding protein
VTDVKPIVETFLSETITALAEGNRIEIRGFGSFRIKNRKTRIGRNPRTGDAVPIPEYKAMSFKFSRDAQNSFEGLHLNQQAVKNHREQRKAINQ